MFKVQFPREARGRVQRYEWACEQLDNAHRLTEYLRTFRFYSRVIYRPGSVKTAEMQYQQAGRMVDAARRHEARWLEIARSLEQPKPSSKPIPVHGCRNCGNRWEGGKGLRCARCTADGDLLLHSWKERSA